MLRKLSVINPTFKIWNNLKHLYWYRNSPKEEENKSDQPRKRKLSETEDSYVLGMFYFYDFLWQLFNYQGSTLRHVWPTLSCKI